MIFLILSDRVCKQRTGGPVAENPDRRVRRPLFRIRGDQPDSAGRQDDQEAPRRGSEGSWHPTNFLLPEYRRQRQC